MSKSRFVRFGAMVLAALVGLQAWATMRTGGGEQNADGSYNWCDKANWEGGSAPVGSIPCAEFPEDCTVAVKLDASFYIQTSFGQLSKLTIPSSSHVTLYGSDEYGTNKWMQLNTCKLFTELTLDKGARISFNNTALAANAVINVKGASMSQFKSGTVLDGVTVTASEGSQVKMGNNDTFANFKNGGKIVLNGTGAYFEASVTAMDNGAIVATDGAKLAFRSISAIGKNGIIALTNASATVSGTFYPLTGGTIEVVGKSVFNPTSNFRLGGGMHFIIDDSTVNFSGSGKCEICSGTGDVGGDTFTFKGKNPKLLLANNLSIQNPSTTKANGIVFEYEIPEGGYEEVPVQHTHASNKLFDGLYTYTAESIRKEFIRVKVLSTSTAIGKQAIDQQLMNAPNGINPFVKGSSPFNFALSGDDVPADRFRVTQVGRLEDATSNANAKEVWVRVGDGEPAPIEVGKSEGVADNTVVSVAERKVTISSIVTLLADDPLTTRCRLYVGTSEDNLVLDETKDVAITQTGEFSIVWDASDFIKTYYFKLVLETLSGEVVKASEESPVKSGLTTDTAAYTWQAVEGDWNGNWSDKAHWTSNQECFGYPANKEASADFPEGMDGTVTLDGAYTIGKLYFRNSNANVTFAPKAGMTAEACTLTVYDFGSINDDYDAHGAKGRTSVNVTFDGVIVEAKRLKNAISTDSTWLLKNGAKCYFRSLSVSGANAWFKVTEGSYAYVWNATSLEIGSANVAGDLGVLVDDAEFYVQNQMQLNANKDAVAFGKVVLRGKNAKFTNTGMSDKSIYSQSACANNHDIVFEIPEGGFANEPVFTVGKQSTPAFSVDASKDYQLGVRFVVDRASPVYSDTGDASKTYKLFESLGGYNSTNVTFGVTRPRAQWVTDALDPHQAISVTVRPAKPLVYIVK